MKKVLLLILSVLMLTACSEETVNIESEAITYEELQNKIDDAESELQEIESNLESKQDEFNELIELSANRKEITEQLEEDTNSLNGLQEDIEKAENTLDKLQGEIVSAKDEPLKINPGEFIFGTDIEPGRYKLTAQEGKHGSVFVDRADGSQIGEIFGDGSSYSIAEYTFEAVSGETIKATIPIYLYPVE